MRIFISWSGEKSRKIAEIFSNWLPNVSGKFKPFVSLDIPTGSFWLTELHNELEKSNCGILCLTKENYSNPWLLYEAGALSKLGKSRVAPFLLDVEESVIPDPLRQLQVRKFNKEHIQKMVLDFRRSCGGNESEWRERVLGRFDGLYAQLEKPLKELLAQGQSNVPRKDAPDSAELQMLRESLEIARQNSANIQQILEKQSAQAREIVELRNTVRKMESRFGASPRKPDAPPVPPGLQRELDKFHSILSSLQGVAQDSYYKQGMVMLKTLRSRNVAKAEKAVAVAALESKLNNRLKEMESHSAAYPPEGKKLADTISNLLKSMLAIKRELDMS